jgi:hypothetical protein
MKTKFEGHSKADLIRGALNSRVGGEITVQEIVRLLRGQVKVSDVSAMMGRAKQAGCVEPVRKGTYRVLREFGPQRRLSTNTGVRVERGDIKAFEKSEKLRDAARRDAPAVQPALPENLLGESKALAFPRTARATRDTDVIDRLFGVPENRVFSLMDLEQHKKAGQQLDKLIKEGFLQYLGQGYVRVTKAIVLDPTARAGFDRMYAGEDPDPDRLARDLHGLMES